MMLSIVMDTVCSAALHAVRLVICTDEIRLSLPDCHDAGCRYIARLAMANGVLSLQRAFGPWLSRKSG